MHGYACKSSYKTAQWLETEIMKEPKYSKSFTSLKICQKFFNGSTVHYRPQKSNQHIDQPLSSLSIPVKLQKKKRNFSTAQHVAYKDLRDSPKSCMGIFGRFCAYNYA